MNREEVLKLAKLARIELADTEADNLAKDFGAILKYVADIKDVGQTETSTSKSQYQGESLVLKNVMREDTNPHESGIYTEQILEQAPQKEGKYLKVKKILG